VNSNKLYGTFKIQTVLYNLTHNKFNDILTKAYKQFTKEFTDEVLEDYSEIIFCYRYNK